MLQLLPPPVRLAIVAVATSAFVLITSIRVALVALLISGLCYAFSGRRGFWRPLVLVVLPTAVLFFLGNIIFPPRITDDRSVLAVAVAHSCRIAAILLLSLAWLRTTPLPELYASLAWLRPIAPYVLAVVRGLQLTRRDFLTSAQSLRIRGFRIQSLPVIVWRRDWQQLRRNVDTFLALLRAVVPRILQRIVGGALAWERHKATAVSGDPAAPALRLRDVYVRYRGQAPVLEAISTEVPRGGVYLVVGHAKAGKTTLLRSASGIIPRLMGEIAGEVSVHGALLEPLGLSECLSLSAYVEPDPATAILGLTVRQELALLANNGDVERLLHVMGLERLAEREVTRLSGGEQVRLVLAGVLATSAPVMLLDEPLSQLDTDGRREFVAALRAFVDADPSRTVLFADYRSTYVTEMIDGIIEVHDRHVTHHPVEALQDQTSTQRWGLFRDERVVARDGYRPGSVVASVHDIHVTLDDVVILRGVSMDVHAGECIVVRGPNGGGKTTLMLALAGAIPLSAGTVDRRGPIGYVFQDVRLQAVTAAAGSEIELAPRLRGWSEDAIRDATAEWLAWSEVDARASITDLHEQDLRFVSAAAMASTASVLVLDEPTVGMDMAGVRRVLDLIERCRSRATAVIVISHDEIFSGVASRQITIRDGRVTDDMEL